MSLLAARRLILEKKFLDHLQREAIQKVKKDP